MEYTVRYAHLAQKPMVSVGDKIQGATPIGIMGNTGSSEGAHLHIDVVNNRHQEPYHLGDMDATCMNESKLYPNVKELNYFIDENLFGSKPRITTYYCEPEYQSKRNKMHPAYDVVPTGKNWTIYWNRSFTGEVIRSEYDKDYGWIVQIVYKKEIA